MSLSVLDINYDELIKAQKEASGGKLFDVITCDPPW
jgi:23S rRNA G2069 N7-methylase RlmK/C1962 C5-methylase RlmI